ncbi:uncharacterized protein TNCV_2938881 [Trichonephila clavipes]|nr:uncharacterized protein TNCV_2938881 [Trichonephila clavipes]
MLRYASPHWFCPQYRGLGWYGISQLHLSSTQCGTLNSQSYISEVLEPVVRPYIQRLPSAIFQQDNARPHVARSTHKFFFTHHIELLPWPACSPHLLLIENVCTTTNVCIASGPGYIRSTLVICGSHMGCCTLRIHPKPL